MAGSGTTYFWQESWIRRMPFPICSTNFMRHNLRKSNRFRGTLLLPKSSSMLLTRRYRVSCWALPLGDGIMTIYFGDCKSKQEY